jgi:hypothetical protein
VPKLQCGGHGSEDLYVTSPTAGAITDAIADKIPRRKTLRDHRDFVTCGPWGTVFRGHFRSPAKQIGIKGEPRLDAILPLDFFKIDRSERSLTSARCEVLGNHRRQA